MPDGGALTITTANQPVTDAMKAGIAAGDYGDHRQRHRHRHDISAQRVRAVLHDSGAVGQWAGIESGGRNGARIRWHGAAGDVTCRRHVGHAVAPRAAEMPRPIVRRCSTGAGSQA
jgi:hypothetical protein